MKRHTDNSPYRGWDMSDVFAAKRHQVLGWLTWNDANGSYTDKACADEGLPPLTLEAARTLAADQMADGNGWLTLAAFRDSVAIVADLTTHPAVGDAIETDDGQPVAGRVYVGQAYIVGPDAKGAYSLTIANDSWHGQPLAELEEHLYAWACSEELTMIRTHTVNDAAAREAFINDDSNVR